MNASRRLRSKAPNAGARRRLPTGLAALALAWHLLAPGLCLAQMLLAGPLGAICSTGQVRASGGTTALPDAAVAGHALDSCSHCLATSAVIAGRAPDSPTPAARAVTSDWQAAPLRVASRSAWRPPPRGPPASA